MGKKKIAKVSTNEHCLFQKKRVKRKKIFKDSCEITIIYHGYFHLGFFYS